MAVTRVQNIMRIRDLLDSPLPERPSFHRLLQQCISEEMDVVNATNNTGVAWATATYLMNYTVGTADYTINVDDWGKVLFVAKLTGNAYIPKVMVPFDDWQNQRYGYVWTNYWGQYGSMPWYSETPEHISFHREGVMNSSVIATINPRPAENWTYEINYLPGYIGDDDPLESSVQLPEHAELVRLRAAMALLPVTEWSSDRGLNAEKRKELMMSFQYQLSRKEALFSRYIQSINVPRTVTVDGWNDY